MKQIQDLWKTFQKHPLSLVMNYKKVECVENPEIGNG